MQAKLSNRDHLVSEYMARDHGFEEAYRMAYSRFMSESVVRFNVDRLRKAREQASTKRMEELG